LRQSLHFSQSPEGEQTHDQEAAALITA